jgi:type II secretory pathway pseudopilin PulG
MGCAGFTYVGLLFFVALMGAALVAVAQVWHVQVQRDKEAELLFVGDQFRRAISLYYERAPGGGRTYPRQIEDLLQDPRYPNVQRYLRRMYVDPMTGKPEWGIIKTPDGSIIGVYSLSEDMPIKNAGFTGPNAGFVDAVTYREWKFAYLPADASGAGMQRMPPGAAPGQFRAGAQPLAPDPAQVQELERAARQPACRAQRAKELEACGQGGATTKECLASASRRYESCLGDGGFFSQ